MTTQAKPNILRFGVYEFASNRQELRKAGIRIRLEGQPLAILKMLLERPGELVTREELQKKLWPADTFVDFEHSLNAAVKRLRSALSDSAEQPRYIETLARRGYRFIAPLSAADAETGVAPSIVTATPVGQTPSIVAAEECGSLQSRCSLLRSAAGFGGNGGIDSLCLPFR